MDILRKNKTRRKEQLNEEAYLKYKRDAVIRGLLSIPSSTAKVVATAFALVTAVATYEWSTSIIENYVVRYSIPIPTITTNIFIIMIIVLMFVMLLYRFGRPLSATRIEKRFIGMRFTNGVDIPPLLISNKRKNDNKNIKILEFESDGITVLEYQKFKMSLENVLNLNIVNIYEGKTKSRIILETISNKYKLPENIKWEDKYIPTTDFELVAGVDLIGDVMLNLARIPHILIGSATGGGKTVLLKSLVYQSHKKGAKVIIADFKGGVDFHSTWKENLEFITDEETLLNCLTDLVMELDKRKLLFSANNCENLQEYNRRNKPIKRIIFACDEVSEVLDKTGLTKEKKDTIFEIERMLSIIARLGRAFGINLILGTQRPDSNILSGQIKNNIGYRICGKADSILSKIILDNTNASAISNDAQGRFITSDGVLFQAFNFDVKEL